MTDSDLIVESARQIMGWHVERIQNGYAIGKDRDPSQGFHVWNPLKSTADAFQLVDRLTDLGFEVVIGCFANRTCVEVRRWRDRRAEGIPGDPHTGRSRETLVVETGPCRLRAIVEACLRTIHEYGPSHR